MPGTGPKPLHRLAHLLLVMVCWLRSCCYSHFTDVETEIQPLAQDHPVGICRRLYNSITHALWYCHNYMLQKLQQSFWEILICIKETQREMTSFCKDMITGIFSHLFTSLSIKLNPHRGQNWPKLKKLFILYWCLYMCMVNIFLALSNLLELSLRSEFPIGVPWNA